MFFRRSASLVGKGKNLNSGTRRTIVSYANEELKSKASGLEKDNPYFKRDMDQLRSSPLHYKFQEFEGGGHRGVFKPEDLTVNTRKNNFSGWKEPLAHETNHAVHFDSIARSNPNLQLGVNNARAFMEDKTNKLGSELSALPTGKSTETMNSKELQDYTSKMFKSYVDHYDGDVDDLMKRLSNKRNHRFEHVRRAEKDFGIDFDEILKKRDK